MKTAVIYARVSSTSDRQNTDRQISDLTAYADKNSYSVECTFEEHISGATKNEDRTVLCDCLNYCFEHNIDTLLISELSRLGRNVDEVLANVRRCKDNNLNIYFQKENRLSRYFPWQATALTTQISGCNGRDRMASHAHLLARNGILSSLN